MKYTQEEVMEFVQQEDVRFIRLAFCNVYGRQHNVAIMPSELRRAFEYGIAIDASAIEGFGGETRSDLLLRPDPRSILKKAVADAAAKSCHFSFGAEMEFYLFKLDEYGRATTIPHDEAGYMDIAPDDKGEHIRREICLMLEQMGIQPECSHHERTGPERDRLPLFRSADGGGQRHHLPHGGPHGGGAERPLRQLFAQAPAGPGRQRYAHQHLRQGQRPDRSARRCHRRRA